MQDGRVVRHWLCRKMNLDGRKAAKDAIAAAHSVGGKIGAFYCESILSCGGQVSRIPQTYRFHEAPCMGNAEIIIPNSGKLAEYVASCIVACIGPSPDKIRVIAGLGARWISKIRTERRS